MATLLRCVFFNNWYILWLFCLPILLCIDTVAVLFVLLIINRVRFFSSRFLGKVEGKIAIWDLQNFGLLCYLGDGLLFANITPLFNLCVAQHYFRQDISKRAFVTSSTHFSCHTGCWKQDVYDLQIKMSNSAADARFWGFCEISHN